MNKSIVLLSALLLSAGAASAQTVHFLRPGYLATDLSEDGRVACGNLLGPYETFRWTEATSEVRLGASTVDVLGVGAGSPDISYDGTRISASIITEDGTHMTQGIWTDGQGWQRLIPPMAQDGMVIDLSYGSAWGLSGDGTTLTGFYWSTDRARPCTWSEVTGLVGLPKDPGRSGRVNGANHDGSIVVGWEERFDGAWQATVWRHGVKIRLGDYAASSPAEQCTADGGMVVGRAYNPQTTSREPTVWSWNGASYDEQRLGLLPGTPIGTGWGVANGIADDGSMIVGANYYSLSPGGPADGFIWTADTGLVKADDFVASLGLDIADEIQIRDVNAISPDGSTIAAYGYHPTTFALRGVIIRIEPGCGNDADLAEPFGVLDLADINAFIAGFNTQNPIADLDGNGIFDLADINGFILAFQTGCP
jgi:uncharacterized membrane protein